MTHDTWNLYCQSSHSIWDKTSKHTLNLRIYISTDTRNWNTCTQGIKFTLRWRIRSGLSIFNCHDFLCPVSICHFAIMEAVVGECLCQLSISDNTRDIVLSHVLCLGSDNNLIYFGFQVLSSSVPNRFLCVLICFTLIGMRKTVSMWDWPVYLWEGALSLRLSINWQRVINMQKQIIVIGKHQTNSDLHAFVSFFLHVKHINRVCKYVAVLLDFVPLSQATMTKWTLSFPNIQCNGLYDTWQIFNPHPHPPTPNSHAVDCINSLIHISIYYIH